MRPGQQVIVSEAERQRMAQVTRMERDGEIVGLLDMLDDRSWRVRREVVAALSRAGDRAVDGLCTLLRTRRDDEARIAATVDALAGSTSQAPIAVALRALATDSNPAIVADAAQILGRRQRADDVGVLSRLVQHSDDNVAVAAIEGLGKVGSRAAVDTLLSTLEGGSFFRVFPAIDVLGRSGDPRVVAPLLRLLADPTYRLEALRALGRTGELAAVAPLGRLLEHHSEAVARVAAVALRDLVQRHHERYGTDGRAEEALRSAVSRSVTGRLVVALHVATGEEQRAITFLLGMVGSSDLVHELVPLLEADELGASTAAVAIQQLSRESPEGIAAALEGASSQRRRLLLPMVMSSSATPGIIAALGDPEPDVRTLACRALARIGATAGVPALFERLADRSAAVAQAAQAAISALGSAETQRLAIAYAHDPAPEVRRAALRILATFGDEQALPLLLEAARGSDARLADVALGGLALLSSPEALEALLEAAGAAEDNKRAAAMRGLGRTESTDPRVERALREALGDPRPWVRYYAAQALGRRSAPDTAEALVALLSDPAGQVRVAAVEALASSDEAAAFEALVRAEQTGDPDMRRAALVALSHSRHVEAEPILVRATESIDAATRLVALSTLAQRAAHAAHPVLARLVRDPDETVRRAAASVAASLGSREAIGVLLDALRDRVERDALVGLLSAPDERVVAEIGGRIGDADDEYASELARILVRMRSAPAAAALTAALRSPGLPARKAAATALGALGTAAAREALREAAQHDPDATVRQICAAQTEALSEP